MATPDYLSNPYTEEGASGTERKQGYTLDLTEDAVQCQLPLELSFSKEETEDITTEVQQMLGKQAISQVPREHGGQRLPLSIVHSPQEGRWQKACHQPKEVEFICDTRTLQNGYAEGCPKTGRLDDNSRPKGCVLYDTNSTQSQTLAQIQVEGGHLPIQLPPIWSVVSTLGLYQDLEASSDHPQDITADQESRVMMDRSDWRLCQQIFNKINCLTGPLEVDLFASYLTHQLASYVSWRPDVPRGNGDRCIHPELDRAQGLCQPSMEPDREDNNTGQKPESTLGPGDASVEIASLVPLTTADGSRTVSPSPWT